MSSLPPTRMGTRPATPEGTGRDGTDGTRGRGSRRRARARLGRALLASQAARGAPGPAVTWPRGRAVGPTRVLGDKSGRNSSPSGAVFSQLLHLYPSGFPFSHSLAVAPSPPGPHVTQDSSRHVTRKRLGWGGIRPLLPALPKPTLSAPAQWTPVDSLLCFLFRNRWLGGRGFFFSFSPIASPSMNPESSCCCCCCCCCY